VPAEALWAYCVVPAGTPAPAGVTAVDGEHPVERVEASDLAALVSRVPLAEFGEEPLRRNLNDFPWLERVARRHETVLEAALTGTTVVPLRMCTIFADEQGVRAMLEEQQPALASALDALRGREEWAVKVLVDRAALEAAARELDPALAPEVPAGEGSGAAYFGRRRAEQQLRDAADRLTADIAEDVHSRLRDWAAGAVVNRPQNPRISGHEGDMVLNGAYLVDRDRAAELHALVAELQGRHGALGARVELTGPLPPFNFGVAT
jgi:Gas vesicle synthesis protein GvpL/GvpF